MEPVRAPPWPVIGQSARLFSTHPHSSHWYAPVEVRYLNQSHLDVQGSRKSIRLFFVHSSTMSEYQALVIGASGLVGWSVVDQILKSYPAASGESPFRKVTALVNRSLNVEDSFWPKDEPKAPKLKLASGINLLCGDEEFETILKENVEDISTVSHVFYFGELGPTTA